MSNSLNLELPYVAAAQAQKHVTVNDAFRRIDSVVQLSVTNRTRNAPPASPQEGDRYIVGPSPSGAWAGYPFNVAAYADGAWVFFDPRAGWLAYVVDEGAIVYFTGTSWEILTAAEGVETTGLLGINAIADVNTRLVVKSDAARFAYDDTKASPTGDTRIYATKAAAGDTASHLFQTNYSGRAEFGLIGSDDFRLKTSPDGTSWNTALTVDAASAVVDFDRIPTVSGAEAIVLSVASFSAIATTNVPPTVNQIETRGYASENDGGGGRYQRVNALPSDGLGAGDFGGGFWALIGKEVTARQAGATGDGSTDDTAALNRALASGRGVLIEAGTYRVTDALVTGAANQRVRGVGRGRTVIDVRETFNMAAAGVIHVAHDFVSVSDLEISFDQSSAASRATLVAYPPAVNMAGETRVRLSRLRFEQAYDGIDATGNTGGAILDDIECGALNEGFVLGGAQDTVELRNCRVWVYNFAANTTLVNIYSDGQTIGFRIGEVDDLKMVNCTPWRCRMVLEKTAGGGPFGQISALTLDGPFSRIEMEGGEVQIAGLYATSNVAGDYMVKQTGGNLSISSFDFDVVATANLPLVEVSGTDTVCTVVNGNVQLGGSNYADGFKLNSGRLIISGVDFSVNPWTNRIASCITQVGGRLTAYGNSCTARTTGAGSFIDVQTAGAHSVFGNHANGWKISLPADRTGAVYGPNYFSNAARIGTALQLDAISGSEGGKLELSGSGSYTTVSFENDQGNARLKGLGAGKSMEVASPDGTARIYGQKLTFTNGMELSQGPLGEGSTTVVGRNCLQAHTSGNGNVMVGFQAGATISSGGGNTGVGRNTFDGVTGAVGNSTALGDGATVNGNNQVQLGNSNTTTYAYGAVQNRSDARDKADVRETTLGLDFIRRLRPVDFRWNYREDYRKPADAGDEWQPPEPGSKRRTRYHHGFLAQEVEAVIRDLGVDFGGYQDHAVAGGNDVKSLGYTELIAPVVKALQELSDRLEKLEAAG